MRRTLTQILLAVLLVTAEFVGAWAATSAPDGPASAPAVAASAALNVADTVAQIAASAELQRAALARIERAQPWHELALRTTALQADFDRLELNRADQAELVELLGLEHRAWALKGAASAIVDELASILRSLERDRNALETESRLWQERLIVPARSTGSRSRSRSCARRRGQPARHRRSRAGGP